MKKRTIIFILISAILMSSGQVLAAGYSSYSSGGSNYIEGYFLEHDRGQILVEEYDGRVVRLPLAKNPNLLIDGRPVDITDFRSGMEIYGEYRGRSINYMDAFSTSSPGYIAPGTKRVTGTVKMIDRDQIKIKYPMGGEGTYFITPATIVLRNKENVSPSVLYVGDNVQLFFDDVDSSLISRMEIEGDSVLVKDIYKGTLSVVDDLADSISVTDVEVFKNGTWREGQDGLKLDFNGDMPVYIAGYPVDNRNLKHYKGKTVYLAIRNEFGKDKAERMVLKNQYESNYSDRIDNVNWFTSEIELANKKNIAINEGTIIIKNGRLVDMHSLNPNSAGLIIADGRNGELTAGLISIYDEGLNNSNLGQNFLYSGRLDRVSLDKVFLRDFFVLNKNEWESFPRDKELFYDNDTYIYDMENGRKISAKEFISSKYYVDEHNRDKREDRDWYAYAWTEGDRIASIYLKKDLDSLLKQRTTLGVVEAGPKEDKFMGWEIVLKDAKDWSANHEEWMAKNASLHIYLKDAMIIKNGEHAEIGDIKPGDRVYLTRDSNMAKVLVIK